MTVHPRSRPPAPAVRWSIVKPVIMTATLVTDDGVPIDAVHLPAPEGRDLEELSPAAPRPGRQDLAIVVAHGFTLSWQRPMVWSIVQRLNRAAGVVTFD